MNTIQIQFMTDSRYMAYYQIPDPANQRPFTRKRIIERNRKTIMKDITVPNRIVNVTVPLNLPKLYPLNINFKESLRAIPKPPHQISNRPQFPFYNRTFRFLYLYIGKKNVGIWNSFKLAYEDLVPRQHRPLENMVDPENLQKLQQKLGAFVRSGLQLRILISKDSYERVRKIIETFIDEKQILQVTIERPDFYSSRINLRKSITTVNLAKLFQEEIKRLIKISTKKKVSLQYNFINLQAKSSQIFHRRNLIQECIKPKEVEQYLQTHKKFANLMKGYENQATLQAIDSQLEKRPVNANKITQYRHRITTIQQKQQKFCDELEKYLKNEKPIQLQQNCQQALFKIIHMYKEQTSIYQIINTNIRISINVNQTTMKCLSTIIKYLYEGILYFFTKFKHDFKHHFVYRGCRMSKEEFQLLDAGSIVMNLGFMSTSVSKAIAQGFLPTDNNAIGCLFAIEIGEEQLKSYQDQQGFVSILQVYTYMKQKIEKQFANENQILFNPLNIFEVTKKSTQNNTRVLYFKYAPHISLANKIKENKATPSEIKKYNSIKANISSLTRTNYDRGKLLHLKGESTKALQHYKQVEETKGETLTIQQQFNKIQILNQIKDFDEMDKCLNKLIKSYEEKVQQIKNPELLTSVQKKQNIIQNINLLTKQSQILQMTSNYLQAEQRAAKAMEESKALSEQMLQDSKKITDKQFIQSIMLDIKSTALLARSKCETNDTENSLCQSFDGLNLIEQVYKRCDESMLPKINKIVREAEIPQTSKSKNLGRIRRERTIVMRSQEKDLKNQLKRISLKKQSSRALLKSSSVDKNIQTICVKLKQYFQSERQQKTKMLEIYSPACKQIQQIQSQKNSNNLKLAKNALYELRELINELIQHENQFCSIIKVNLKSANQDIRPCLENQRKILQHRFGKFLQFQQVLKKNENTQLNTDDIKNYNQCVAFLLEYTNIVQNEETQRLRQTKNSILRHLNYKILKQSSQNNIKLTAQKTLILESQSQEYKNTCYDANIIQSQSNKLKNSLRSTTDSIKTISSYKSRQSFDELTKKLENLQKIHEEDNQINKFYFLLKDMNDYLELVNSSYSVAESTEEYNQLLAKANRKAEMFQQKYELMKMKINETLVKHYYLKAQTQLKRGYFKQSRILLTKAQDSLQNLYERKIGVTQSNKRSRDDRIEKLKNQTLNKLFAREITIQCYRLQAELIGIYYGQKQRKELFTELELMKKFVQKNAPNKIITQALINQALAFIAMRCMPFSPQNRVWYSQARESLDQSIKLRKGLFGSQNQYLAIAYSNLASLQKTRPKSNQSRIKTYYQNGINIFYSLEDKIPNQQLTYLDKQPMLYLYRMELQAIYNKIFNKKAKDVFGETYTQNIDGFDKNSKDLKSLFITQNIMKGAVQLSQIPKYQQKSQKYLQKCQKQIESIEMMNKQDDENFDGTSSDKKNQPGNETMLLIKDKLYKNFVEYYKKSGNSKKLKKYQQKKKVTSKKIAEKIPRQDQPRPVPSRPRRKSPNIFEFTLKMFEDCTGLENDEKKKPVNRKKQQKPIPPPPPQPKPQPKEPAQPPAKPLNFFKWLISEIIDKDDNKN